MAVTKWTNVNGGNWGDAANWDNGVPDSTVDVVIDTAFASGNKIITLNVAASCKSLDSSAAGNIFTLSSSVYTLSIYGNLTEHASNSRYNFTGTAYMYQKGTGTITTNGNLYHVWNRWYIDGVGITVTNGDDFNLGASSIYLYNGTYTTNDKTITTTGVFRTDVSTTRVLNLGNSTLYFQKWDASGASGLTVNEGTSTVYITTAAVYSISGGNKSFYNLVLNGAGDYVLTALSAQIKNNLTITLGDYSLNSVNLYNTNITVNGTLTINGFSSSKRTLVYSNTLGTPRTITCNGTTNITNCDFQDITLAGTANRNFSSQTDIGDCGGNSGITFPAAIDCYIKHTSGAMSWSNVAKWVTTDGGSTQARVPLPQDRAWGTANSFTGTSTLTLDCPRIGSIDLSTINQTLTYLTWGVDVSCYGNFVLWQTGGVPNDNPKTTQLVGRGNYSLKTFGKQLFSVTINAIGGIYDLLSDYNAAYKLGLVNGTFNLNSYLISLNYSNLFAKTGGIINAGTSTIKFNSSIVGGTFQGGGATYYNLWVSGTSTDYTIVTGSNTFNNIKVDPGQKLLFNPGVTSTINTTIDAVGSQSAPIQIGANGAGNYNLVISEDCDCNFISLSRAQVSGKTLFAGDNSTDGGNNSGNVVFGRMFYPQIISI